MIRRIVISVVAAAAIVGIAMGFSSSRKPVAPKNTYVREVYPPPGDLDLRQVQIGAKLAPGYTGTLQIDGAEVVQDDIHFDPALYTVMLQPSQDSPWKQLSPGQHCAIVLYWPIGQSATNAGSYR